MSKQMKTLLALIIVSMLTVLCACNSVAPPDRQNTPAEALSDNGNGDGLSSDFTDDSTGADVSETTSEESETTSGEESDQSEPEGDRSEEEQSETENSQSGTDEQSVEESDSSETESDWIDEEMSGENTIDGDTAPVSELVLFVPAGSEDNKVGISPPIESEIYQPNMPHNMFVDNDGTINIYDFLKERIVSFRDGVLVDEIDLKVYGYSYYPGATPSANNYSDVTGDSEHIYLAGRHVYRDTDNVYVTPVKICVINRRDKTGTVYDIMPALERESIILVDCSTKLNGKAAIDIIESSDLNYVGKQATSMARRAFATDSGLSIVDKDSVIRCSSEGAERTCYTIAGSSPVRFSAAGLPGGKYKGNVIAVTGRYLYFRTWSEENQFTSYIYKVERSSSKIIGYVKHAKPDCLEWKYCYYVTDNDELYYMESIRSDDAEKCGTSVYKETFGNDFESIRIQDTAS
ncbi:MAG: hypothetical protein SOV18_07220 [Eubacteriales bacterium]|nr:hypothetical protein [Eubacteriales bacterium]